MFFPLAPIFTFSSLCSSYRDLPFLERVQHIDFAILIQLFYGVISFTYLHVRFPTSSFWSKVTSFEECSLELSLSCPLPTH